VPVRLEARGRVAVLTLDRADRLNTLSPEMLDSLVARLDEVEADDGIGAAIVIGDGDKAFSAGADVSLVREASPLEARAFAARGHATCDRVESLRTPVIAAVNGYALGGGCELALACDIRLASDRAQIGLPEVTLGIFPGWGGTQRMPRLIGPGRAKELIFTGRRVGAEEALATGLVNGVHPHDELLDAALELAADIAAKPAWALAAAKEMINRAGDGDQAGNLRRELDLFALAFATEDQREGMGAFFEKRAPQFRGR
jgi:enoyl-CoA hydratase